MTGSLNSATSTSTSIGLSTGAIAGIGGGVALNGLEAAVLGLFLWRRSRNDSWRQSKLASSDFSQGNYGALESRESHRSGG